MMKRSSGTKNPRENKGSIRRVVLALVVLLVASVLMAGAVSAEGTTYHEVNSAQSLMDAINGSNSDTSSEHTIVVTADISLSKENETPDITGKIILTTSNDASHTISWSEVNPKPMFSIRGGELKLVENESFVLTLDGNKLSMNRNPLVYVDGGTFTMEDGLLTNNFANGTLIDLSTEMIQFLEQIEFDVSSKAYIVETYPLSAGGVYISSGTFVMNGGEISGNVGNSGSSESSIGDNTEGSGGVYVGSSGTFTMNGGDIKNNNAIGCDFEGDTITFQYEGETFTAPISGQWTGYGGGVYVDGGSFTMNGGNITGNAADSGNLDQSYTFGGGVYVDSAGKFTISGGNITDNTVSGIRDNHQGGGVALAGKANSGQVQFTMTGGKISGNTAEGDGGGVYIGSPASFTMSGGEISGNTVTNAQTYRRSFGSGVYADGKFTMSGSATINKNNDVYLDSDEYISITGNDFTGSVLNITGYNRVITAGYNLIRTDTGVATEELAKKFALYNAPFYELVPDETKSNLVVKGESQFITTESLSDCGKGIEYKATLKALGDGVRWSISAGKLPTGLSLDAKTGVISGTPTVVGTESVTIKAEINGMSSIKEFSIKIYEVAVAPSVDTTVGQDSNGNTTISVGAVGTNTQVKVEDYSSGKTNELVIENTTSKTQLVVNYEGGADVTTSDSDSSITSVSGKANNITLVDTETKTEIIIEYAEPANITMDNTGTLSIDEPAESITVKYPESEAPVNSEETQTVKYELELGLKNDTDFNTVVLPEINTTINEDILTANAGVLGNDKPFAMLQATMPNGGDIGEINGNLTGIKIYFTIPASLYQETDNGKNIYVLHVKSTGTPEPLDAQGWESVGDDWRFYVEGNSFSSYIATVSVPAQQDDTGKSSGSSSGSSVWLQEPVTPTETPTEQPTDKPTDTVPTDIPSTQPTSEPSTPGFGVLAVLAGLGAIAVMRRR